MFRCLFVWSFLFSSACTAELSCGSMSGDVRAPVSAVVATPVEGSQAAVAKTPEPAVVAAAEVKPVEASSSTTLTIWPAPTPEGYADWDLAAPSVSAQEAPKPPHVEGYMDPESSEKASKPK